MGEESPYNNGMKVNQVNVDEMSVVVTYMGKERLVTFNHNGDIDIEPYGDLNEEEGQELFNLILQNDIINAAFPSEDF